MDEEQFWSAALRGDDRAFAQIFDAHQAQVVRHAARLIPNRRDAEDVAAVAFLELWRCRNRVRIVNGSVLPWLLVTTTNVARNSARSIRRYERMLMALPRGAEPSIDPAEVVAGGMPVRSLSLERAMQSLRAKDAALFILTAVEGMSIADAARAIGISPEAARVRLHRARAHAQKILKATS
jgi:RNA polymerase sigma factor (sigma-70 family)